KNNVSKHAAIIGVWLCIGTKFSINFVIAVPKVIQSKLVTTFDKKTGSSFIGAFTTHYVKYFCY
ncbi:hypothetical protein OFN42_44425, partial [Escherichia coli]|nr:hypothetical protein [Escherichia coli]